jgi:polar amino acid transport system substrate-binding protein
MKTPAAGRRRRRMAAAMLVAIATLAIASAGGVLFAGKAAAQAESESDLAETRQRAVIRFLTADDYPPFNARDEDGSLTGLNVDLARAICLELATSCDLNVRPWETLIDDLVAGQADAVIAAHKVTPEALSKVDFTDRYFFTPARFVSRRNGPELTATPTGLDGRTAGVIEGSPHEAFLQRYFRNTRAKAFPTAEAAREAMLDGDVDLLFDDGISLAFWANGSLSRNCCRLIDGAFFEPAYFGDGIAIAVGRKDRDLRSQINDALKRIKTSGRFQELVDRYFPIKAY